MRLDGQTLPIARPATVVASLAAHALSRPGRLAVEDGRTRLTFGELERRAAGLARALRAEGVGRGSCVGLWADRSVDFVVAAYGILKAGAAYLPIDPATPPQRVGFILRDAGVAALIADGARPASETTGPWPRIDLEAAVHGESLGDEGESDDAPTPEDLAYVIYTSGSTGRPKGVEISHGNLENLIAWHNAAFGVTSDDRASLVAGLGFDAAVWELWPALAAGASVHIADDETRRSPRALRDWLVAGRINVAFAPTLTAEALLEESWPAGTALRTLLTGADTLRRRPPAGLPFTLVNNYGPTECTVVSTSGVVRPEGEGGRPGLPSIGRPIRGLTALVLDEQRRPVPHGEAGELAIAGVGVGIGYRNNPALTAERFVTVDRPGHGPTRVYRTGDRVRWLPDGELAFLGRLDDQVKIRGNRVEPAEVSACLDRHPGVAASAVLAREEPAGLALVAYVVPAGETPPTATALRAFLAESLADYMIPSRFVRIAALPTTPNGKLDRAALPSPDDAEALPSGSEAGPAVAGPVDGAEATVAAMVASLLGVESVGRDENFFLLGGHSMFGVQLIAKIRDEFGVRIPLRQLFGAPTVASLAAAIERSASVPGGSGAKS